MPSDVTREEFKQLATRVDVVEHEVEGEKAVTRHILEQTRRNTGLLANVLTRLGGVETRVRGTEKRLDGVDKRLEGMDKRLDGVESRLGGVETRLGRVEVTLTSLARNLPKIVGDAVRNAMRERKR